MRSVLWYYNLLDEEFDIFLIAKYFYLSKRFGVLFTVVKLLPFNVIRLIQKE